MRPSPEQVRGAVIVLLALVLLTAYRLWRLG
jgi:flagellar biogenesis protein FliO